MIEPCVLFLCALCETRPTFDGKKSFGAHCKASHPEVLTDQGVLVVDLALISSKDWPARYENTFRGTLPDGRVLFEVRRSQERDADDPMREAP